MPLVPARARHRSASIYPGMRLGRPAAVEPMLPAMLRGVIFLAMIAAPFVATLLAR